MPPTVTIPYMEAWRWRKDGLTEAKIKVQVCLEQSTSSNVIAEIPGTNPQRPAILLTAHHDTQVGNTGADDNASLHEVVRLIEAVIPLVNKLCRMPDTKIARGHISREHKELTQKYARELFNL